MTGRDEIADAIEGSHEGGAPPAVFTQTGTCEQMEACGRFWPEANWDPGAMAELSLQLSRMYGFATARVPFSITTEAETMGCSVDPGSKSRQPSIRGGPFSIGDDPDLPFSPEEFPFRGSCGRVIEALGRMDAEEKGVFLVAGMVDPMFLAMNLLGAEALLMGTIDDPEGCRRWVGHLVPYVSEYGKALSERSDCVLMICSAGTGMLSPDIVDGLVLPGDRKAFGSMRESFRAAHCCEASGKVSDGLFSLGEDVLSMVTDGDPEGILEAAGDVRLIGGANPVRDLLLGNPESVVRKAKLYSDMGYALIGPECGIPPMAPGGNLAALASYRSAVYRGFPCAERECINP
jgi:MtaA/CmuA family methyltransferase